MRYVQAIGFKLAKGLIALGLLVSIKPGQVEAAEGELQLPASTLEETDQYPIDYTEVLIDPDEGNGIPPLNMP